MRVELNRATVRDLLRDPSVTDLAARAGRIAEAAGPGMEASVTIGRNRAHASVRTATWPARYAEARERKLSRAIDAGR